MVEIESDWIRLDLPEISSWWRPPKGTTTGQVVERWEPVLSWDWRHVGRFIVIFSRLSLLWPNRKPKGNDSVGRAIGYRGCDHHIFLLESNQILYFAIYSLLFGEETKRKCSFFCTVFLTNKTGRCWKIQSVVRNNMQPTRDQKISFQNGAQTVGAGGDAELLSLCQRVKASRHLLMISNATWWFQMTTASTREKSHRFDKENIENKKYWRHLLDAIVVHCRIFIEGSDARRSTDECSWCASRCPVGFSRTSDTHARLHGSSPPSSASLLRYSSCYTHTDRQTLKPVFE